MARMLSIVVCLVALVANGCTLAEPPQEVTPEEARAAKARERRAETNRIRQALQRPGCRVFADGEILCLPSGAHRADSELRNRYCAYGTVSRSQLAGCLDHVTADEITTRNTNAAAYARGDLTECLNDAGPYCFEEPTANDQPGALHLGNPENECRAYLQGGRPTRVEWYCKRYREQFEP